MNLGTVATALIAILLAFPASGTGQPPSGGAAPRSPATDQPTSRIPTRADESPPSRADPRVCLEFPTNAQVVACAEKHRRHGRRR